MKTLYRLLNAATAALYGVGLTAASTFFTNTRTIGVRDSPLKEPLILGSLGAGPLAGMVDLLLGRGGPGAFLGSLFRPGSFRWAWRALFTFIGARYLAQQVHANRHPVPRPRQILSTGTHDIDLHEQVARAEGIDTRGLKGKLYRLNEVYTLQVTTLEVQLPGLPPEFDGFRIAQLSDLHYGDFTSEVFVKACVDTALDLNPDLIALTGDFQHYEKDIWGAARLLAPVGEWSCRERGGMGAFAVLGNHDTWCGTAEVTQALREAGISVLHNRHVEYCRGSASLYMAGVADMWSLRADLDLALHGIPEGACVVLLAHVPDMAEETAKRGVALQLSGHLHGGQIVLPFVGAMLSSSRFSRRYVSGAYKAGDTLLYSSRGLGGHPPIRWNVRPEIPLFILRGGLSGQT